MWLKVIKVFYYIGCDSKFTFNWTQDQNEEKFSFKNLEGNYENSCGINISFKLEIFDYQAEFKKVNSYSFIITLLAILQIANTIWMTNKINDSAAFSNSVLLNKLIFRFL